MTSRMTGQHSWFLMICSLILIYTVHPSSTAPWPTIAGNGKLRFVHIIMNIGKRAPNDLYLNDPNNALWTDGPGNMIEAGKQDTFQLGRWVRHRYGNFLSDHFMDDEINFRSTEETNQLLTTQIFAAGLYSLPNGLTVWSDQLQSTFPPVPVLTMPVAKDPYAKSYMQDKCTRMQQFMSILENVPEERRVTEDMKLTTQGILQESGRPIGNFKDFLDFTDVLAVEKANNLKYPDWISGSADYLLQLRDYYTFKYVKTPEIAQLSGGYLIREIFQRINDVIANKMGKLKAYVISTNELSIIYLLSTLRSFNFMIPSFSSALILELYETPTGDFNLQILYANDTSREPYIINFPTCPQMCPWQFVNDFTRCYFIDDIQALCDLRMTRDDISKKQQELNQLFP